MPELREIRVQTDPSVATRTETYLGREYLVAPVIMLCEGVLQGANADSPEYCPASELESFAQQWNGRPVVMNHPKVQGTFVSANHPEVLEDWQFGFVFNAYYAEDDDGNKLKAEAWLDVARAEELGGEFQDAIDRINNGEVVEVSTGLYCGIIEKKGKFNSQPYTGVWVGVISDHLAILSDGVIGACSVEGGCGIPRINERKGPWGARPQEMRINTAALRTIQPNATSHEHGLDGHCCESCKDAAMSKPKPKTNEQLAEEAEANANTTVVEPTEAELQVLRARAEILVHAIPDTLTNEDASKLVRAALANKLGKSYVWIQAMTRDQVVYESYADSYCCGGGYKSWSQGYNIGEDNAVTFDGDPQEVVLTQKITPVVNSAEGAQSQDGSTPSIQQEGIDMSTNSGQGAGAGAATTAVPVTGEDQGTQAAPIAVNSGAPAAAAQPQNLDAWMASAPPEVASIIRDNMRVHADNKARAITAIKSNSANVFTDEQLNAFDLPTLDAMAKLAVQSQPAESDDSPAFGMGRFNYGGRGGSAVDSEAAGSEEEQRNNAGKNRYGGAPAPKVFSAPEDFAPRVGAFRKN